MSVLLTRPERDSIRFAECLGRHGVDAVIAPVMRIEPVDLPPLDLDGVQGFLVTSANGAEALARATPERDRPVLAVGPASAVSARDLGFRDVTAAEGDVAALAALARQRIDPGRGRLVHMAGSSVAGNLAGSLAGDGITIERVVGYHARASRSLPRAAADALSQGRLLGVVLFSPRTAAVFAGLVRQAGLESTLRPLAAFCLSAAVADALDGLAWRATCVAARPEAGSLVRTILDAGETHDD